MICRSHADQVKATIAYVFVSLPTYLLSDLLGRPSSESRWSKPGSGIKIVPIVTAKETFSPGDAMRDIYTRGLVTSDFVLVMGDLVSNIRIDEVVRVHKERRKVNKDAIMTMVVKESGAKHRTRSVLLLFVTMIHAENLASLLGRREILLSSCWMLRRRNVCIMSRSWLTRQPHWFLYPVKYWKNTRRWRSEMTSSIAQSTFAQSRYIGFLTQRELDHAKHFYQVPSLFQDNFDYLDIRRDFVHGVLTSDLLMKNIYCYVAKDGYAARVKDTKSYESVR